MKMERFFETYLGDGVFVYLNEARQIVLYTSDGIRETNHVFLEPEVLAMFKRWADQLAKRIRHYERTRAQAQAEGDD